MPDSAESQQVDQIGNVYRFEEDRHAHLSQSDRHRLEQKRFAMLNGIKNEIDGTGISEEVTRAKERCTRY